MLALIVIVGCSISLGTVLLKYLHIRLTSFTDFFLITTSIGLGCLSLILFFMGHAGLFYKPVFIVLSITGALPGLWILIKSFRNNHIDIRSLSKMSAFNKFLIAGMTAIALLYLITCYAPVTGGMKNDEICTHLSIPNEWLHNHGFMVLPYAVSLQAGNAHLIFLLASCFENEAGPHCVSWLYFVLCIIAAFALGRRFLNRDTAYLAAAFAAINPLVFRSANVAFVDLASSLFAILPFYALLVYKTYKNRSWLFLSGFFAAIGIGIKPTNIIYSGILIASAIVLLTLDTTSVRKKINGICILAFTTVLIALPWPLRNTIFTGFPVYPPPLALIQTSETHTVFAIKSPFTKQEIQSYYTYCQSRYGNYTKSIKAFLRFPWDITIHPQRFQIGQSIGSIMLTFAPLAILFLPLTLDIWLCILFAGISSACIYTFLLPEARYYMAAILLLCPVAVFVFYRLANVKVVSLLCKAIIIVNVVFSLSVALRTSVIPLKTVFSHAFREQYKQATIPYYEAFSFLDTCKAEHIIVPHSDRILYYLRHPYSIDTTLTFNTIAHGTAYLLDLDYSQNLERNIDKVYGDYSFKSPPANSHLIFKSIDARIYLLDK